MRNPLNQSLKKELRTNLARYLAIFIVMVLMISVVSGFLSVAYSAKDLLEQDQIENHVEDGQLTVSEKLDQGTIHEISEEPLTLYENFYYETTLKKNTTLRLYKERKDTNRTTVFSGRMPTNPNEIALDRLFAQKNEYIIGDKIKIDGQKYKIVGYLSFPDYSSLIENNNDLMMDPIHFGVGIVSQTFFNHLKDDDIVYNYNYLLDDQKTSTKDNYDQLNKIKDICLKRNYIITDMMTKQMNQAISFLPNDMGGDLPMFYILFFIILVILAFIFVVISQAIIEQQSTIIGTLLANGYTKYELVTHYLMIPMFIVVLSAIIGNILGYTFMPLLVEDIYYNSYCLPPLQLHFHVLAFVSTTLLPVVIMFVVNFIMLSRKLNRTPLQFLRKDLRKHKKTRYIYLKKTSFIKRYRTRVILQNIGSYILLFIGIIFATFLLSFGLVVTPTLDHYIENISTSMKVDYQYILKVPVEADGEKITYTSLETYYEMGDLDLDISFYGLEDDSYYYQDMQLPKKKNQIIISSDFAKKMNLKKGDDIKFSHSFTEKTYHLKVIDIYDSYAGFSAYMSRSMLNDMLGYNTSYFNGYLSNKKLDIDEHCLSTTITKDDMTKIGDQMTQVFSQTVYIFIAVGMIIFVVVIYILTKLVLDRNVYSMSFMKVMGYNHQEIAKVYLKATAIVVIAALLVSLPISKYGLQAAFIIGFSRFAGYMEGYFPTYLFAMIFLIGLVTYFIIDLILTKQIHHIELGESLKDVE